MALQKIIRFTELPQFTGLRRTAIREMIEAGTFPKPVQLTGRRAQGWTSADIERWQRTLIAKRDGKKARARS